MRPGRQENGEKSCGATSRLFPSSNKVDLAEFGVSQAMSGWSSSCTAAAVKHSPSRMHWGCFSWQGVGPIVPIKGSITGTSYVGILQKHATLTFMCMFPRRNGWFQHDNARPHTAKISLEFLEGSGMRVLDWPAQSPDLNPIENLWAIVKRSIRQREKPPSNVGELEKYVQAAWKAIPLTTIRNLIDSMPQRI